MDTRADDFIGALAVAECWSNGDAWRVLCDSGQRKWLERVHAKPGARSVWKISRQRGKTYAALAYALSECLREPGFIVRYAAKTKESAEGILVPTLEALLASCPEALRPKMTGGSPIEFANGSKIFWAGTDAQTFDRLRGPRSHLILLDESAFYQDLPKVESALFPSTQTTKGRVIYLSSPPETPAHEFAQRFAAAEAAGNSEHETIYDNPRLTEADITAIANEEAKRLGLEVEEFYRSTFWRREYLAEDVTEENRAAFPHWVHVRERVVREVQRPEHFDAYCGGDAGYFPDPFALLWGYYDFARGLLVIERELELYRQTTRQVFEAAKVVEAELYGPTRYDGTLLGAVDLSDLPEWLRGKEHRIASRQPFLRACDAQPSTLAEFSSEHGFGLLMPEKSEKQVAVDAVDDLLLREKIVIHPRCVRLIEQCKTTLWNKRRTEWERTPKGDHGDLVDALIYLVRMVRWHRDCRPPKIETVDSAFRPDRRPPNPFSKLVRRIGS